MTAQHTTGAIARPPPNASHASVSLRTRTEAAA